MELRDVAADLGHAWPVGRSPRRAGEWLGRLLAAPVTGAERPDRPRRGREQAPEAAQALDRLVGALEHSRYSRHPESFTAERFAGDADLVEQALAAGVTVEIHRAVTRLYDALGLQRARIRLVGVRLEKLVAVEEAPIQGVLGEADYGWRDADRAVDRASARFGAGSVRPASLIGRGRPSASDDRDLS